MDTGQSFGEATFFGAELSLRIMSQDGVQALVLQVF